MTIKDKKIAAAREFLKRVRDLLLGRQDSRERILPDVHRVTEARPGLLLYQMRFKRP